MLEEIILFYTKRNDVEMVAALERQLARLNEVREGNAMAIARIAIFNQRILATLPDKKKIDRTYLKVFVKKTDKKLQAAIRQSKLFMGEYNV